MLPFTKTLALVTVAVAVALFTNSAIADTGTKTDVLGPLHADPMATVGISVEDLLFLPFSEIIERELAAVATREEDGAASPLGTSCCSGDEVCYAPFQACLAACPPTFPENFSCIGTCRQQYVACTIAVCGG